jgi:hypothetical protein
MLHIDRSPISLSPDGFFIFDETDLEVLSIMFVYKISN